MTAQLTVKGEYNENVRGIPVALEWELNKNEDFQEQVKIMKEIVLELNRCASVIADARDKQLRRASLRWRNIRLRDYAIRQLKYLFEVKP